MNANVPALIEGVFTKLILTYGSVKVDAMYKGQEIEAVKHHWAHELRGLSLGQYEWALSHLPELGPPNVLAFRTLARARPEEPLRALDGPPADPQRVREVVAALKGLREVLVSGGASRNPKAWAWKLKDREESGEKLTSYQKSCWRTALARELGSGEG